MSNSLEEVLNEYLSLKEQELHLDASVQSTKAIREIYFEDNEL